MKKILLIILVIFFHACKKNNKAVLTNSTYLDYQKGDSLFRLGNDSAFYYYNKVANNSTSRLEKAGAYNRMATMQFNSGDHFGSQETVTESQKLLDEKILGDQPYLLSNYNLLGRSYLEQKDYDAAIRNLMKAEELQAKDQINSTLLNNLAVAYQNKKDFSKAKNLLQFAIDNSKQDTLAYARALSNLARTKWLENSNYYAAPELLTALTVREIKNDRRGLNASYLHLSDYYFAIRPDSSLFYAKKMYQLAQNPDDILEAIEKITRVASANDAQEYSRVYYKLNDSLKQARSVTRNQFAAIRFETEKNKADNFQLQRDNFKQRIYIYIIIVGFILVFALSIVWYLRRKRRIEQESQKRIREHQLNTSKKVHDVVANGLYQIMADLEHRDEIDKESMLDKIEMLYEQSRDISYDQPSNVSADYSAQINRLFNSFSSGDTKVLIAGNQEKIWSKLSKSEKTELEYILRELMINMSKHSKAKNVVVKFSENGNYIKIHYKDDGTGLSPTFKFGNGLRNTETRIKNLGGTIIFDGNSGLKIEISLPTGTNND